MKKNLYPLLILMFIVGSLFSQNETKNWYFGNNAGLTFTSAVQTLTNSPMMTSEGTAVMSDAAGQLLFYTDGVTVYDKTHSAMANGTGLLGDVSSTQSALIIKKPGSNTLYYIFTLPAEGTGDFCYSVVDMSLASGNGSVTIKNTILSGNVTEKMSAVHNCNGTDIWVLIHSSGTNTFKTYSVSATGINTTAIVSNVGPIHTDVHGYMKFNNAGTRVACSRDSVIQSSAPFMGKAHLDLFQFNNQTGVVSSPTVIQLGTWQKSYGLEFSPNNSKVYITRYDISGINGGNSEIVQFDMNAANIAATSATVASLNQELVRALQVASDGKIYVAKSITPFVCVLDNPNNAAASVTFSDNAINIDPDAMGYMCMLGLPNFYTSYFNAAYPALATCTTTTTTAVMAVDAETLLSMPYFDNTTDQLVMKTELAQEGNYSVVVTDISGRKVYDIKFEVNSTSENKRFDLPELSPGVYIVKTSNERIYVSTKFIKQ
jgi:hypothetical protein